MPFNIYASVEGKVMKHPPIMVRKIEQADNESFRIEWSDGVCDLFRLDELQRLCPCAQCFDPATGRRSTGEPVAERPLSATTIESVGRYALRVRFTSGCSKGIFSFSLLREIGRGHADA